MVISLTTDFGHRDPFVGIMKGVIARINPAAGVIDLTHGVPAGDVMAAALALRHATNYFPSGTIHVAVVDPGVGGERAPLLIESAGCYFVGPDNGIFSLALQTRESPEQIFRLSNPVYQLQPTSRTFHGRDIFAPAAAHLSLGAAPAMMGEAIDSYAKLALPPIHRMEREIEAEVIYIDGFGNLFTNLEERDLTGLRAAALQFILGPLRVSGLARSYSAAGSGQAVAVINSWGLVEIAVNRGDAQRLSGANIGDKVRIRWASQGMVS